MVISVHLCTKGHNCTNGQRCTKSHLCTNSHYWQQHVNRMFNSPSRTDRFFVLSDFGRAVVYFSIPTACQPQDMAAMMVRFKGTSNHQCQPQDMAAMTVRYFESAVVYYLFWIFLSQFCPCPFSPWAYVHPSSLVHQPTSPYEFVQHSVRRRWMAGIVFT